MPGLDFYKTPESSGPAVVAPIPVTPVAESNRRAPFIVTPSPETPLKTGVYYNPRLDPKNFLEGPLSWDPATRLRQMLARPGIVVRKLFFFFTVTSHPFAVHRLPLVFAMVLVPGAHSRPALTVCTKAELLPPPHGLVNLTLPSLP